MGKKEIITILSIIIVIVSVSSTIAYAETSDNEANCDSYEKEENIENKKVIVIGAGISGLAAAHHLHCIGYDVEVLEAQDRIGGRIYSDHRFDDVALDRGASWIHGIEGSPIFDLATKYDIRGDIIITNQESSVTYDSEGKVEDDRVTKMWETFEEFDEFLKEKQKSLENDVNAKNYPLTMVVDEFISDKNLTDQDLTDFYYTLYWGIELDNGFDADETSLLYQGEFQEYPSVEVIFKHGYDQIINGLAEGLKIHENNVVTEIDYTGPRVNVKTEQGETFEANYVVSTIPLGVLDADMVTFKPDLSPSKKDAIDKLDMGVFDKVYLIFEKDEYGRVFWETDKNVDWITRIPAEGHRGEWVAFLNLYKYTDKPVLLAFTSGKAAVELNKKDDATIIAEGMNVLQDIYENKTTTEYEVPDVPKDFIIQDWENEKYMQGSFSYFKKGVEPNHFDALAAPEPLNENKMVFFAGEATIPRLFSTVNGAYVSGIRASEEIQREDGIIDLPEKQLEYGMHPAFVVCEDYHVLILKTISYKPFCVAKEIADTLVTKKWLKGEPWATYPKDFPFDEFEESHSPK